jgi:hypothetical protein
MRGSTVESQICYYQKRNSARNYLAISALLKEFLRDAREFLKSWSAKMSKLMETEQQQRNYCQQFEFYLKNTS